MEQVFFFFDQNRCTGCGACSVACKDWNGLPAGSETQWRRVYSTEAGRFPDVDVVHLCMSCFHCEEPACAKACPTGAISKRESDGIVLVDRDICNGCRECLRACPYGAPQYEEDDHRMMKCTFCVDRQDEGLKPACVEACPYLALDSGTEDSLQAEHGPLVRMTAGAMPGIYEEHAATAPSVFIKARPLRAQELDRQTTRKNGVPVEHLRTVRGPSQAEWRSWEQTPLTLKDSDGC